MPVNQYIWNGEYYVNFGDSHSRNWDDAIKYGFISAGNGRYFGIRLKRLSKGNRVWVYIPQKGYVAVGRVEKPAVMAKDFTIKMGNREMPVLEVPLKVR